MNEEGSTQYRHRITYRFDKYLMYLIQDVTKKPSAEILNFFYELSRALSEESIKKVKNHQRYLKRTATDYFPDSSVPFHVLVKGDIPYHIQRGHKWENNNDVWDFTVEVGFPDETSPMPEDELQRVNIELMENALFDAGHHVEAPKFMKPEFKSSESLRKLMNSFMGRGEVKKPRKSRKKVNGNVTEPTDDQSITIAAKTAEDILAMVIGTGGNSVCSSSGTSSSGSSSSNGP